MSTYYLEKEQRTLNGCRTGFLILILITFLFWWAVFELIKML